VKHFEIDVAHLAPHATANVWRLDASHGNVLATFDRMGRPAFPSRTQLAQLRAAGREPPPQTVAVDGGRLALDVPPQGLVVVTLAARRSGN
jgi:xylan 1,4-beta-xylosidase